MKFYEVIFLSVIIGLFSSSVSGYVVQIRKLDSYIEQLGGKVMSLDFISESFRNVCAGKGFKSFDEWEDACRVLWNLDFIEWKCTGHNLYLGRWSGPYGSGEVYCRMKGSENGNSEE